MDKQTNDLKSSELVAHIEFEGHLENEEEHEETPWTACRNHPKVVLWCVYTLWVLILNSFENQAAGSILGIPEFRKDFGRYYNGGYVLPAEWQAAFNAGPVASTVIGGFLFGWLSDRYGRRYSILLSHLVSCVSITVEFVSTTNAVFFTGKFIGGFAHGGFLSITFSYVGEIVTVALRGIVMSAVSLSFSTGPLIAALIVKYTGTFTNRWAYRAVFCAQYGVQVIALIGWFWMPESPWWLIEKGKEEEARQSLRALGFTEEQRERRLAATSLRLEQANYETATSTYMECFRKSNLRRTLISVMPLAFQSLAGIFFVSTYATYYFQLAGYSTSGSFVLGILQQVLSITGNICSWYFIDKIGRRNLVIWGLSVNTTLLLTIGGLGVAGSPKALKASCALILVYCYVANASIGAAAHTLLAEVATSRLRIKTIAIGNGVQNVIYTMWSFVIPYVFNPDQANLGPKVAFIFGGLAVICLVILWFSLVETKGRTYEEIDELFIKGVYRKEFATYETDAQIRGREAREAMVSVGHV